ncbi:MAG: hypothetical protein MI892_20455, partial [Desulfobacterales bacterium]|nr:hypothetical protein [Desulfobacterales bacterium]
VPRAAHGQGENRQERCGEEERRSVHVLCPKSSYRVVVEEQNDGITALLKRERQFFLPGRKAVHPNALFRTRF